MKKILRQTLFTIFLIGGASLATFAQSSERPKGEKPLVPVKPKETPAPTPKPEKPNKPSMEISGDLRRITLIS